MSGPNVKDHFVGEEILLRFGGDQFDVPQSVEGKSSFFCL